MLTRGEMKSNRRMQVLLEQQNIDLAELLTHRGGTEAPRLEHVDGCVFLEQEYRRSKGVALNQFPDRTGMECFVNHVHFQIGEGGLTLEHVFDYIAALSESLKRLKGESFQVILSIANEACTVRFHRCRPGEEWIANDLERYGEEAVLVAMV